MRQGDNDITPDSNQFITRRDASWHFESESLVPTNLRVLEL